MPSNAVTSAGILPRIPLTHCLLRINQGPHVACKALALCFKNGAIHGGALFQIDMKLL